MWQTWFFLTALLAVVLGVLCSLYERLRPSRALRLAVAVLALAAVALMLPVLVDRALDKPVMWLAVALLAGLLATGPAMVRQARRPPADPAGRKLTLPSGKDR
ncbi:hypothetical protein [Micromonospora psammae]|uniref:hypothetical protein n=1 Tax=Micromonospora sp. CPCC 205556 TaxID=3122398 RepID=UPI002FF26DF8